MFDAKTIDRASLPFVQFSLKKNLPKSPGIYFILDCQDNVRYIGASSSLRERLRGHNKLKEFQAVNAVKIAYLAVSERRLLSEIETALICHFTPDLNRNDGRYPEQDRELSLMETDILLCLSDRELYGLQILERLNRDRPTQLQFASVYPALSRGYDKGLLAWRWGDDLDESGGARRKYFKVTEFGKELLEMWQKYREGLGNDFT